MSLKGTKRRPWLEIKRLETERAYLSYQLFSLRRSHDGPFQDTRDVVPGQSFYDDERIRFQGEGLYAAYDLLYPRDRKIITKEVMDLTDLLGLTAIWMDCGRISLARKGLIRGRFSQDEYLLIAESLAKRDVHSRVKKRSKLLVGLELDYEQMTKFARLIRPHAHYSMKAKLQLKKSPKGSGQTRSQPTDRQANALLQRI